MPRRRNNNRRNSNNRPGRRGGGGGGNGNNAPPPPPPPPPVEEEPVMEAEQPVVEAPPLPLVVANNNDSDAESAPPPLEARRDVDFSSDEDDEMPLQATTDGEANANVHVVLSSTEEETASSDDDDDSNAGPPPGVNEDADNANENDNSDEELPPLVHRELMDSSSSSDEDGDGDDRRPARQVTSSSSSDSSDDDDDDDDEGPAPPPPMGSRAGYGGYEVSIGVSSEEEEDDDDVGVEGGEDLPLVKAGDYVVYQIIEGAIGPPKQWTQGRVVKVKKKKNQATRKNKAATYQVQPLDAEPGATVQISSNDQNKIALDPTQGAVLNYKEGDRILYLVPKQFQISRDRSHFSKDGVTLPYSEEEYKPAWADARIVQLWPTDLSLEGKPMPYVIEFVDRDFTAKNVHKPKIEKQEGDKKEEDDKVKTALASYSNKISVLIQDEALMRPVLEDLRFKLRDSVDCHVGPGKWIQGIVSETNLYVTPEDRCPDWVNHPDPERWETSHHEAYRILVQHDPNKNHKNDDDNNSSTTGIQTKCLYYMASRDSLTEVRGLYDDQKNKLSPRALLLLGMQHDARLPFFRNMAQGHQADQLVRDYCPEYWIHQAIQVGSYHALLWMEQDLGFNLDLYQFPEESSSGSNGNKEQQGQRGLGLLHCLVLHSSPEGLLNFLAKWASKSHFYHSSNSNKSKEKGALPLLMDCLTPKKTSTSTALTVRNQIGRTWLHCLAAAYENEYILKAVSSLVKPSASKQHLWELVQLVDHDTMIPFVLWKDDRGKTAADSARAYGRYRVAKMLDDFGAFCCVHKVGTILAGGTGTVASLELLHREYARVKDTTGDHVSSSKKGLLEDLGTMRATYGHGVSLAEACLIAAQTGNLPVLKWLHANGSKNSLGMFSGSGSVKSFFQPFRMEVDTTHDRGEFTWKAKVAAPGKEKAIVPIAKDEEKKEEDKEGESPVSQAPEEEKEGESKAEGSEDASKGAAEKEVDSKAAEDKVEQQPTEEVEVSPAVEKMPELDVVGCAVHGLSALKRDRPHLEEQDKAAFESTLKRDYWKFVLGVTGEELEPSVHATDSNASTWAGNVKQGLVRFLGGADSDAATATTPNDSDPTWTGDVKQELVRFLGDSRIDDAGALLKRYKLGLIQDDPSLDKRLQVLQWLVVEQGMQVDLVNVMRWRQCGVLRWMVDKRIIRLDETADSAAELTCYLAMTIQERTWIANKTALKLALRSLRLGQMLCFLAVEFDDLQSLDYLLKERRIDPGFVFQGWTLLHVAASFGRREIAAYLIQLKGSLVSDKRAESRFEDGNYASHIATESGDLLLTSFFLKKNDKLALDSKGRSIQWYGQKSENPDVMKWLGRYEKKAVFEKDITSLCAMLFASKSLKPEEWENIKSFITEHNCLSDEKWLQHGYESPGSPVGQGNGSFWDIVDKVAESGSADFLLWFHGQALPSCYYNLDSHKPESVMMRGFWKNAKSQKNDMDPMGKNGKKKFKEYLDMVKKGVEPDGFAAIDAILGRMITRRQKGIDKDMGSVAPPIDGLYKRMEAKVHKRRDTKAVQCFIEKKRELLYQQFVTDILLTSAKLIEHDLEEGSVEKLEVSLKGLVASAKLLDKDHPILLPTSTVFGRCPFLLDGTISDHQLLQSDDPLALFATRNGYKCNAFGVSISRGHLTVLQWLTDRFPNKWDEQQIPQLIRLAEFCGQSEMVEFLVEANGGRGYLSAVLGAADAGRTANVKHHFPSARKAEEFIPGERISIEECPLVAAVEGLYRDIGSGGKADEGRIELVRWLGSQPEIQKIHGVQVAAKKCMLRDGTPLESFLDLFRQFYTTSDEIWCDGAELSLILRDLLYGRETLDVEKLLAELSKVANQCGVDVQSIFRGWDHQGDVEASVVGRIEAMQQKQLRRFTPFRQLCTRGMARNQMELIIKKKAKSLKNARGLNLAQAAAFCDQVETLEHVSTGVPTLVHDTLKPGLDVLARNNEATKVLFWVEKRAAGARLSTMIASHYRRKQAVADMKLVLAKVIKLQWVWRGHSTRLKYRKIIEARLDQRKRYELYWSPVIADLARPNFSQMDASWDGLQKNQFNLAKNAEHLREYGETFKALDDAQRDFEGGYGSDDEEKKEDQSEHVEDESEKENQDELQRQLNKKSKEEKSFEGAAPPLDNIKITKAVLTWIRKSEGKYVDYFLRRIQQLAAGERSRILQKNLVGSNTTIYETYLEMSCAQRILWTPVLEEGKHSILVWYVARHKEVSRLMELIDLAQKRSSKEFVSAETLYDDEWAKDTIVVDPDEILLDPIGDVPLKLHQIPRSEIANLSQPSWVPPLRLTPEERKVVDKDGTVLLLGRSGTGKTLCISNRIVLERDANSKVPGFQQLFVARSKKICRHVRRLVGGRLEGEGENKECKFLSWSNLLKTCCTRVSEAGQNPKVFNKLNRVNFQRFRRELVCQSSKQDEQLDPLVVWAQINNFIKGSIEAVQQQRPLTEEEYLALGERQCRLTQEQRKVAYSNFRYYQKELERSGLWDDSDRCGWLLRELNSLPHDVFEELRYSRVYVDEIQDYSQVQLALFFTLCKNHKLFLAGDNAQSVEEGVDFRFEDLRAVAHSLYQGNKRYIPEKPLKVNKNFRSHAGILRVAAAILERLFAAFPASIHRLDPDEGVFLGPRPGILKDLNMRGLASLLKRNPRLMVLTHDDSVMPLAENLAELSEDGATRPQNAIIGIRDAKGLEFRDIVIVNFFSDLEEEHQKAWRELLRDRDITQIQQCFPQLEGHLKLLYTACTRCSRRLFFVETKKSIAGQAFFRWLATTKSLAEYQEASKMETAMTPDEWRCFGVDLACTAEETDENPRKALGWLDRAIDAFQQVGADGDETLLKKAKAHRDSLLIRVELEDNFDEFVATDENEEHIATVAQQLLGQSLLPELCKLLEAVSPKLNHITQEGIQKDLLDKLEDHEA